jgi:cation:H+ antiporter
VNLDLIFSLGTTLLLLALIVWACGIFTNAIEWLGHRFNLSEGAVGSVLAAVGTALPETLVPIVALLSGFFNTGGMSSQQGQEIGIGAILGAPFLLGTLAMGISGLAVFYFSASRKRSLAMTVDTHLFKRDMQYFFSAYGLALLAGMQHLQWLNITVAIALLFIYAWYVYRTFQTEHGPDGDFHIDPLMFAPKKKEPATGLIIAQVAVGLLGILLLAHLFVDNIHHLSGLFRINALILSLIVIPIATELPEKVNSVVWLGKKKDSLALGNITGAMVFQSCIPVSVGLVFTPWMLSTQGLLSVILCFASAGLIYALVSLQKKLTPTMLLWGVVMYAVFLGYSIVLISSSQAGA